MKNRFPLSTLAATAIAALLAAGPALALSTQELIDSLTAEGFTRIEVKTGPTQTKVEAIRGTEKVETVYDNATGEILKTETETVRPGENTAPGIRVRERARDFVGDRRRDRDDDSADDDDDDDSQGRGRGRGRGGDDRDDDDRDDDNGGDRDDDDRDGDDD